MKKDRSNGQIIYSPSDLITYSMDGEFASWMNRAKLEDYKTFKPLMDEVDEMDEALQEKGHEHEEAYLKSLIEKGIDYVEIDPKASDDIRYGLTIKAMEEGRELIYQGFLQKDNFKGNVDFLFKKQGKSKFGDHYYEPYDTKLSGKTKPYMIIQMLCYIEMLEVIQEDVAREFHLVLGDLTVETYRCDGFRAYYDNIKRSFLELQSNFNINEIPDPALYSTHGNWSTYAKNILEERDHLSQVARITKNQIELLGKEGVTTMEALSKFKGSVTGIQQDVLERIVDQASLQISSKGKEKPDFRVLPPNADNPHKGLYHMPPASKLDVFFDLEGYPLFDGGLEYLWGATYVEGGELKFIDWWAHSHEEEKKAFENFIDWAYARWQQDPTMHIYHYANYEIAVCRKLMGKYGTREYEVDQLLRNDVFVDLYNVVRNGIRIGGPNYSIKTVELIYRGKRDNDVANAAASVVYYANWMDSGQGNTPDTSEILKEIYLYNKDDCDSTLELAKWLWDLQDKHGINFENPNQTDESDVIEAANETTRLRDEVLAKYPPENPISNIAWLQEFHRREDKPVHWKRFDREKSTTDELFEELDCLAGLTRTDKEPVGVAKSLVYEYCYNTNQETRMKAGSRCYIQGVGKQISIYAIDYDKGLVEIKSTTPLPSFMNLIPDEIVPNGVLRSRIASLTRDFLDGNLASKAFLDFIQRKTPDIKGVKPGESIIDSSKDLIAETIKAVTNMNETLLTIQGPPGTGKTHTSANTIIELVKMGYKVGITSNSHKAIINLMNKISDLSKDNPIHQVKAGGDSQEPYIVAGLIEYASSSTKVEVNNPLVQVVGGTSWAFASNKFQGQFDYLFIDEAGQVSIANLMAVSGSTRNIVLMGDQQQLPQPLQGTHVQDTGLSTLEYLLQDNATIPPELGILLPTTWRLHPEVCEPISKAVYDGRLLPQQGTKNRVLLPDSTNQIITKGYGIEYVPVHHTGNTQASVEEVKAIEAIVEEVLKCDKTDRDGKNLGKMTKDDILIVAPYNHQKNLLEEHFLDSIKVGTVDLFQGQEKPVAILSMCASNLDDAPRGIDFLLNMNRLNVAITRAQSLAIIVASPEIGKARARSIKQMEMINLYCSLINRKT
jgi:predicted RecB family nuclease